MSGGVLVYLPYPILIAVIVFLFLNGDKVEKWSGMLARLFSFFSARAERASVARDIQGRINEVRSAKEFKQLLPYGLKIRWEKGETVSELKDGDVIVVMSEHKNQARNFLNGLMAYLSAGLLPKVRPYTPPKVARAIELLTASKILARVRIDAIPIYKREIADPELGNDKELAGITESLEKFDDVGYFTRIFLRELSEYGQALSGSRPKAADWEPVQKLMEMMTKLVAKPPGQTVEEDFIVNTEFLSVCIVLVAALYTLVRSGTEAHVNYVNRQASKGITRFYILARGVNASYGKEVAEKLVKSGAYQKDYEESFKVNRRKDAFIASLHLLRPPVEPQ